jgi:hypothetical protein
MTAFVTNHGCVFVIQNKMWAKNFSPLRDHGSVFVSQNQITANHGGVGAKNISPLSNQQRPRAAWVTASCLAVTAPAASAIAAFAAEAVIAGHEAVAHKGRHCGR